MCSGSSGQQRRRELEREQENQEKIARQRQEELDNLAKEREAIAAAQLARSEDLQRQQRVQAKYQELKARNLQRRQAYKEKEIFEATQAQEQEIAVARARAAAIRAEAEAQKRQLQATGQAVSASLGVLSRQGGKQGKTAKTSKRKAVGKGPRATTASLNIGETVSDSGSGSNLSI